MYEGRYAEARSQARIGLAVDGGGADSLNLRNFRAAAERAMRKGRARNRAPDRAAERERLGRAPRAMTWLGAALVALLAIVALRWPAAPRLLPQFSACPPSRRSPRLAAMVITWSAWGSLNPLPTVGDEVAYVLQAKLLARGHIAGDAAADPRVLRAGARARHPPAGAQVSPRVRPRPGTRRPARRHGAGTPAAHGADRRPPLHAVPPAVRRSRRDARLRHLVRGAGRPLSRRVLLRDADGRTVPARVVWAAPLARSAAPGWLIMVSLSMAVAAITRPLTALVFAVPSPWSYCAMPTRLRPWRQVGVSRAWRCRSWR